MTWCKSYDCRNSATENGYCVSCTQMLARADAYEDRWPSSSVGDSGENVDGGEP